MKQTILIKYGEIILKGLNRPLFEDVLIRNIKRALRGMAVQEIWKAQATIYVEPGDGADLDEMIQRLQKVFGIVYIIRASLVEKDMAAICRGAAEALTEELTAAGTFKVETKRADKRFPLKSPEVSRELGGYLLEQFPHLSVDVNHPDKLVMVEIRDRGAYVYCGRIPGAGGMPTSTNGRAALLLSGGIDSPVAGYMVAKRGVSLDAVHFFSHPYTSERAKEKVLELANILCTYIGGMRVFIVPFTEIQLEIKKHCPEEYLTVIMRRFMMKIAELIAQKAGAQALVTGESIGQVASQTIEALAVTNAMVELPVFRPLIGMDKEDIVTIARKIGTFDTSILPYEDCCTVFTPRHPATKPKLEKIKEAERALDYGALLSRALDGVEVLKL